MNSTEIAFNLIKNNLGLDPNAQVIPFGIEAFSKFGDCINQVLEFFADGAISGFSFLVNYSLELFISIATLDLALSFIFSGFKFSPSNLMQKVLKYGFCVFAIKNWNVILNDFFISLTTSVGQTMTGASVSQLTENLTQPQLLMRMAIDNLPGLNIIANSSVAQMFENCFYSLVIWGISWFVLLTYLFLAIKIAYIYIHFYVSAAFTVWGLPLSVNGFVKFIPEKFLGSLWGATVSLMMSSVMIYFTTMGIKAYLPSLPSQIKTISDASQIGFLAPYCQYCAMLIIFAYLAGNIPQKVAEHLSGPWEL